MKSLKSLKKLVGSISQRYGSGDPDPHQNVTDPQQDEKDMLVKKHLMLPLYQDFYHFLSSYIRGL
jgi:hypothetical protein